MKKSLVHYQKIIERYLMCELLSEQKCLKDILFEINKSSSTLRFDKETINMFNNKLLLVEFEIAQRKKEE